ncbi:MAG: TauD/TfdA family dioxygenase [Granulosicoccus sp.]|nr:TauD/TfdA family dioxygenase [Granulosicoccus sp.]
MSPTIAIQPIVSAEQTNEHTYSSFSLTPLNGALGAEIHALNLSKSLSTEVVDEISLALSRHKVLAFRNQSMKPADLVNIGNRFGSLHKNPFVKGLPNFPEVIEIRSEENHEKQFTGLWHSDISWAHEPSMGSLLYAVELPPTGGDTLFANMALAFSALSPGFQQLLRTLRAEHRVDRHHSAKGQYGKVPQDTVYHPVVTTHPETGEKILFVNEYFTTRFEGMSEQESLPVLQYLFNHSVRADFTCRIQWQPGTLIFWDNRSTMHYATNDYAGQKRLMHRVTIAGEAPT